MDHAAINDITDVQTLKAMLAQCHHVIAAHELTITRHEHTIAFKSAKIDKLTHEIARLRRVQFAAKSERMDPAQRELFDEAMAADIAALEAELASLKPPRPSPRPASAIRPRVAHCRRICRGLKRSTSRLPATASPAVLRW
jgi:transposase